MDNINKIYYGYSPIHSLLVMEYVNYNVYLFTQFTKTFFTDFKIKLLTYVCQ